MGVWKDLASIFSFGATSSPPSSVPVRIDEVRSIATTVAGYSVGRPSWPERTVETFETQGFRQLSLIFAAALMTADALASATLRVYDEDDDDAEIERHPLRDLMKRPNPEMEEAEWLTNVALIATITGTCVIEKERSNNGRVIALWPLETHRLAAIAKDQAPPDWEYTLPGGSKKVRIASEDAVVFPYAPRGRRSPFGMGPVEACLREIGLANRMNDFLANFFDRGAVPQYGLVPDPEALRGRTMTQAEVNDLVEQFVRYHGGLSSSVEPVVLQAIKDIKQLSINMDQMAWPDLRDLTDLAIAQAFRIPASMLQVRAGLEHSDSRANAEVDQYKFYRQTISPLWRRLDGVLSLQLLPDFDARPNVSLEFDTSDVSALQEDRNAKAQWVVDAFRAGLIPASVATTELGMPEPAKDFYIRSMTVEAIPANEPIPPEPEPPKATPPTSTNPIAVPNPTNAPNGKVPPPLAVAPNGTTRAKLAIGYEARSRVATSNKKKIAAASTRGAGIMRDYFRGLENRVMDAANRSAVLVGGRFELRALQDVNWDREQDELGKALSKVHRIAMEAAYVGLGDQIGVGISFDLANPNLRRVADTLAKRVVGINETSQSLIQDVVTSGLEEGVGLDGISANLQTMFDGWKNWRADMVARTEAKDAFAGASIAGYKDSGVVDRAQIFDNPDHDEDYGASDGLTCAERDGIVVDLDEAFAHVEADHPNGSATVAPVLAGDAVD